MKKGTRVGLATGAGILGALVLGYWIYGTIAARAVAHTFEAFGFPMQTSRSVGFYLLPLAGTLLVIIAISLLVAPRVARGLAKARQ
jgi:hypothetical protein